MTAHERASRLRALAVFAVLGGLVAWSTHLWLVYSLGDYPCRAGADGRVLGLEVSTWWYALSIVAGVVALGAVAAGVHVGRARHGTGEAAGRERGVRWLGIIGAGASTLFLTAIALAAIAPLIVPCS